MIQLSSEIKNKETLIKTAELFKKKEIILPTFTMMKNPEIISDDIKNKLKNIG
jgi:hypothetical protein